MAEQNGLKGLGGFAARVVILHTATYMIFGLLASQLFDYGRIFEQETVRDFMRPFSSPWVLAGPFLQPFRGLILALGLWPLRRFLVESRHGWLVLWGVFLALGILGPPAAAPGSMEGVIYSQLPLWFHLIGWPEIGLQTLAFSAALVRWERHAMHGLTSPAPPAHPAAADLMRALVIACLAWLGYAVSGLLSITAIRLAGGTRVRVDVQQAAGDVKILLMFAVAFVVNLVVVFAILRHWRKRRLRLLPLFLFFWAVDTMVPWVYQLIFTHPSAPHLALLFGLFPALIITAGLWLGFRKPAL